MERFDGTKKKQKKHLCDDSKWREKFLIALEANHGIITLTCRAMKCTRWMFYHACDRHPDFKATCDQITEIVIDEVEDKFFSRIFCDDPDLTAMIFYLKCKAKHRGYIDRQEVSHSVNLGEMLESIQSIFNDTVAKIEAK